MVMVLTLPDFLKIWLRDDWFRPIPPGVPPGQRLGAYTLLMV